MVVQNPTHLGLPHVFAERFSPEILSDVDPLASLLGEGVPLALGTDGWESGALALDREAR
ncbi:hypothetical protein [Sorangium sp. So ce542]|uniref:hypothetical protein n=1 Tax=Sorangium sp. So ce542 TaxID=3133316 RepID=UPI003F63EAA8